MTEDYSYKTSWSDSDLTKLTDITNHKIVTDKDGKFRWYHNLSDEWCIHSIKIFEDYKQPYSWLMFWLSNWSKELNQRNQFKIRKESLINRKVRLLKKSVRKANKEKVIELSLLRPSFTSLDIANELGVSIRTVQRALNNET